MSDNSSKDMKVAKQGSSLNPSKLRSCTVIDFFSIYIKSSLRLNMVTLNCQPYQVYLCTDSVSMYILFKSFCVTEPQVYFRNDSHNEDRSCKFMQPFEYLLLTEQIHLKLILIFIKTKQNVISYIK